MDSFFESLQSELEDLMGPEAAAAVAFKPPNNSVPMIQTRKDPTKFERFVSKGPDDLMTPNDSIELLQKDLDNTLDMLNLLDEHEEELYVAKQQPAQPLNELFSSLYPMYLKKDGLIQLDQFENIIHSVQEHIQKLALKIFIHHPQTHAKSLIINQFSTAFWMVSHLIDKCALSWDGYVEADKVDSFYALNTKQLGWTLVEIQNDLFRPIMHYECISNVMSNWQQYDGNLWLFPFKSQEIFADLDHLLQGYPKMVGFLTIETHSKQDITSASSNKKRRSMFRTPSKHNKAYRYYCQVTADGLLIKMDKEQDKKYLWQDFHLYSHINELSLIVPDFKHSETLKKHQFTLIRKTQSSSPLDDEKLICFVDGGEKLRDWQRSIQCAMTMWTFYQYPEWFFDSGEYNDRLFGTTRTLINKDDLVSLEDDTVSIHKKDLVLRRSLVHIMQILDKKTNKKKKRLTSIKDKPQNQSLPSLNTMKPVEVTNLMNESTPNLMRSTSNGSNTLFNQVDASLKQKLEAQYPGLQNDGPFIQLDAPPPPQATTLYDQLEKKKKHRTSLSSGTLYDAIQKQQQSDDPYNKI